MARTSERSSYAKPKESPTVGVQQFFAERAELAIVIILLSAFIAYINTGLTKIVFIIISLGLLVLILFPSGGMGGLIVGESGGVDEAEEGEGSTLDESPTETS